MSVYNDDNLWILLYFEPPPPSSSLSYWFPDICISKYLYFQVFVFPSIWMSVYNDDNHWNLLYLSLPLPLQALAPIDFRGQARPSWFSNPCALCPTGCRAPRRVTLHPVCIVVFVTIVTISPNFQTSPQMTIAWQDALWQLCLWPFQTFLQISLTISDPSAYWVSPFETAIEMKLRVFDHFLKIAVHRLYMI